MAARKDDQEELFQELGTLLWSALGPAIWALHFLAVYATGAVLCARAPAEALPVTRVVVAVLTVLALAALVWLLVLSWRRWDYRRTGDATHTGDSDESRHRFGGHAAFLLNGLAIIGVLFSALPPLFIGDCR